mgnify:FL=1
MAAGPDGQRRHREGAQIVLLAAEGKSNLEIAEALGIRPATVSKGRGRSRRAGVEGLQVRLPFRPPAGRRRGPGLPEAPVDLPRGRTTRRPRALGRKGSGAKSSG